jgi:hypothetical protein
MADEPLVPLTRPQLQLGILEAFDASMDILRPGEKGAVDIRVTTDGADVIIAVRAKNLEAGAAVSIEWHRDVKAGGFVRKSW